MAYCLRVWLRGQANVALPRRNILLLKAFGKLHQHTNVFKPASHDLVQQAISLYPVSVDKMQ